MVQVVTGMDRWVQDVGVQHVVCVWVSLALASSSVLLLPLSYVHPETTTLLSCPCTSLIDSNAKFKQAYRGRTHPPLLHRPHMITVSHQKKGGMRVWQDTSAGMVVVAGTNILSVIIMLHE